MIKLYTSLILLFFSLSLSAQVLVQDANLEGGIDYVWTADTEYLIDGYVYLESGATLTIEPGTVIKGKAIPSNPNEASTLIITKGAKIIAEGTANNPIIFTGELDDLTTTTELTAADNQTWGGLIILGNSIVGEDGGEDVIEGIPSDEERIKYGGNDPADDSGVLKYVSIRHGGAVLGADNEINGLTLGGVGNGTTIDYIEVFANKDDGIEFFGGTVNVTHAVVAFCGDDSYDFDESYNGFVQYALSLQGEASGQGDNAIEYDGTEEADGDPNESGRIYNGTFIGAGPNSENPKSNGFILKKAGNAQVWNSIFVDQKNYVYDFFDASEPAIATNIVYNNTGDILIGTQPTTYSIENVDPQIAISRFPDNKLNPVPSSGSPALSGASAASEAGVDVTTYIGAFENDNWAKGWTALDEYGYFVAETSVSDIQDDVLASAQLFPNPVQDQISLQFELESAVKLTFSVYDITGRKIQQSLTNENFTEGKHNIQLDASMLSQGSYILLMESPKGLVATNRFIK